VQMVPLRSGAGKGQSIAHLAGAIQTDNNGGGARVRVLHCTNAPGPNSPIEVLGEVPKAMHEVGITLRRKQRWSEFWPRALSVV